ncbi:hypothetical protein PVT71_20985 [Salipiger sp. H15]|uniref:DUF3035 domain-containing protein n=1 Tax=Alloyangia sp. H15 TaxID=3029062 RepID=A0AAU8ALC4_9RHOB
MKSLAVVAVLAAMLVVVGLAATGRARTPKPDQTTATPAPETEGETYAMSIGRPVELTQGERQQFRTLVPGIDPATVPPEMVGKVRAILYGKGNDAEKRSRIESLLG